MPLHHHSLITFKYTYIYISLIVILSLLTSSVKSHYKTPASATPLISQWESGRATYYAAADPREYSRRRMWVRQPGQSRVWQSHCWVKFLFDLRNCIPATSILVTATNFCPPNYAFSADAGGSCNPPNKHFVLPIEAF
ncbi:Expansin-A13 [Bienertia sinuspersici]